MSESTLWWIIAGFFVSLELLSGSMYLLMLGLGAGCAGLAALAGATQTLQLITASGVGGGAVLLWHRQLLKRGPLDTLGYNTTGLGQLDVGEEIPVSRWNPDGTTHVQYRGSEWLARFHGTHVPRSGLHRIRAIEPNYLVLEQI
jgi:membrane protein implicated in regulation of membrane protease activity